MSSQFDRLLKQKLAFARFQLRLEQGHAVAEAARFEASVAFMHGALLAHINSQFEVSCGPLKGLVVESVDQFLDTYSGSGNDQRDADGIMSLQEIYDLTRQAQSWLEQLLHAYRHLNTLGSEREGRHEAANIIPLTPVSNADSIDLANSWLTLMTELIERHKSLMIEH